jgi:hypothetical protein
VTGGDSPAPRCDHVTPSNGTIAQKCTSNSSTAKRVTVALDEAGGHCCIKAKGVLVTRHSGEAGTSGTVENRNKLGI